MSVTKDTEVRLGGPSSSTTKTYLVEGKPPRQQTLPSNTSMTSKEVRFDSSLNVNYMKRRGSDAYSVASQRTLARSGGSNVPQTRDDEATTKIRHIFKMGESIGSAHNLQAFHRSRWLTFYQRVMRWHIPGITRSKRSLYLFHKNNAFRRGATMLVEWQPFDWIILAAITANCIVLGLDRRLPRDDKLPLNLLLEETEIYFMSIFTLESLIKITAHGFVFGRGAYLKNPWNLVDFIVVVTGLVPFFVAGDKLFDLRVLRAVRVLRPLKLVSGIPSLQVVLTSIVRAMEPLMQIALLVLFAILMFAIIGLEFYSGIFHQSCYNIETHERHIDRPCPVSQVGQQCDQTRYNNDSLLYCLRYWEGPNYGITNFDNIGFAMLTVFQCVTMEGWVYVMYWTDDAMGTIASWLFFVPLIFVGSFFMLNLVLGVLSGEFSRERKRVEKRRRFMRTRRRQHLQKELNSYIKWISAGEDVILNEEGATDEEKLRIIECRRHAAARHLRQMARRRKKAAKLDHNTSSGRNKYGRSVEAGQTVDGAETLDIEEDEDEEGDFLGVENTNSLPSTAYPTPEVRRKNPTLQNNKPTIEHLSLNVDVSRTQRILKFCGCLGMLKCQHRVRSKLRKVVKTEVWFWTVISFVFLNSISLAVEHYEQPDWLAEFLYYSEFVFASLFMLETFTALYAFGPRIFFMSTFRIFDTCIIIGSLFEVILAEFNPEKSFGISVLRSLRLLRIFKLTRHWSSLRNLVMSLYNSMRSIISLLFLLFLFVMVFAMLGMQVFGGQWNFPEGRPSANFDSLPIAMMTVFQILTGEDWNEVLYSGIRSMGGVRGGGMFYSAYFILLVLLGNYTLLNVFLAIAVDNLSQAREMTALEEARLADEAEQKVLQKKAEAAAAAVARDSVVTKASDKERSSVADVQLEISDQPPVITDEVIVDKTAQDPNTGPVPMLPVKTLLIFGPSNPIRRICHFVINQRYFEFFSMLVIGASSFSLAAEDTVNEEAPRNIVLMYMDYVFTGIFTLEMSMKIIDFGLLFHEGAYFRELWNVLDFLVVICALGGFALKGFTAITGTGAGAAGNKLNTIKALRALRVLRPLKTINRLPKLKAVFQCVVNSLKDVTNILIVYLLFNFIFACVGVQLFKGKFFSCTDASMTLPDGCHGYFYVYDTESEVPRVEQRIWKRNDFHYDHLPGAMLTLFTVTTCEGWPYVLAKSIDATHEGQGGQPGYSKENAIFYIAFFIIFPFFFINIFVALIIITFQEQGETDLAGHHIDKNQKRCIEFAINAKPISRHMPGDRYSLRYRVWQLVDSTIFEYFIMVVICLNTLVLMIKTKKSDIDITEEDRQFEEILSKINLVFTGLFSLEACLKLTAFGPKNFFSDPWNTFDFLIVVGSIADIITQDLLQDRAFINFSFLRLFRAARLIKLLRLGGSIRVLLWTFIQSCKALPWVFLLIGMLFFIYAIIGMQVFGNIAMDEMTQINSHNNFQNFFSSLLLLFRCATGEAWQLVMLACLGGQKCDPVYLRTSSIARTSSGEADVTCGHDAMAYIYFVSFVFLSTFLMLNLFIAVIMDNFDYLTRDSSILGPHHLEEYLRAWAEYDPDATGRVHYSEMYELLKTIEPPLGFGEKCPARLAFRKLIRMNAPLDTHMTVQFNTTLFGLIRESLKIKLDVAENMDERDRELRSTIKKLWPHEGDKMANHLVPLPFKSSGPGHHQKTIGKIYSGLIILENWRRFRRRVRESFLHEHAQEEAAKRPEPEKELKVPEIMPDPLHEFDVEKASDHEKRRYHRYIRKMKRMSFMRTMGDPRASSPSGKTFPSISLALAAGAYQAISTSLPPSQARREAMNRLSPIYRSIDETSHDIDSTEGQPRTSLSVAVQKMARSTGSAVTASSLTTPKTPEAPKNADLKGPEKSVSEIYQAKKRLQAKRSLLRPMHDRMTSSASSFDQNISFDNSVFYSSIDRDAQDTPDQLQVTNSQQKTPSLTKQSTTSSKQNRPTSLSLSVDENYSGPEIVMWPDRRGDATGAVYYKIMASKQRSIRKALARKRSSLVLENTPTKDDDEEETDTQTVHSVNEQDDTTTFPKKRKSEPNMEGEVAKTEPHHPINLAENWVAKEPGDIGQSEQRMFPDQNFYPDDFLPYFYDYSAYYGWHPFSPMIPVPLDYQRRFLPETPVKISQRIRQKRFARSRRLLPSVPPRPCQKVSFESRSSLSPGSRSICSSTGSPYSEYGMPMFGDYLHPSDSLAFLQSRRATIIPGGTGSTNNSPENNPPDLKKELPNRNSVPQVMINGKTENVSPHQDRLPLPFSPSFRSARLSSISIAGSIHSDPGWHCHPLERRKKLENRPLSLDQNIPILMISGASTDTDGRTPRSPRQTAFPPDSPSSMSYYTATSPYSGSGWQFHPMNHRKLSTDSYAQPHFMMNGESREAYAGRSSVFSLPPGYRSGSIYYPTNTNPRNSDPGWFFRPVPSSASRSSFVDSESVMYSPRADRPYAMARRNPHRTPMMQPVNYWQTDRRMTQGTFTPAFDSYNQLWPFYDRRFYMNSSCAPSSNSICPEPIDLSQKA